jgi:hypothetical protein
MPADRPPPPLPADEPAIPSPRTTIVGGRPPAEGAELPPVPTGLQRLLRLASVDEAFRGELLRRRAEMATVAGIELSQSERAILAVVPERQIATMVENLPPPSADRRDFLRQSARAAVLLLGGAALTGSEGCRDPQPRSEETKRPMHLEQTKGERPDPPPERHHVPDPVDAAPARPQQTPVPAGIRPAPSPPPEPKASAEPDPQPVVIGGLVAEPPPSRIEQNEMQAKGGAAPDEPPPRPKRPNVTRGIRPRKPDAGPPKPPPKTRGHSGDIPDDPF